MFFLKQSLSGVKHDGYTQNDQQECQDQLKSFYHEDCGSGTECFDQCDGTLYKRGKGYSQPDDQRWEQGAVLTFGYFQEDTKCDQYQST